MQEIFVAVCPIYRAIYAKKTPVFLRVIRDWMCT